MATRKTVRRVVKRVSVKPKGEAPAGAVLDKIKEVRLDVIADSDYYAYGVSVIEDRAIFGSIDGLKPVARRALWAVHKLGLHSKAKGDKAAKAVGETLGNYHPHGDKACFDAMVNAVTNHCIPLLDGEGNWGTMTENAAAMRYVNLRLSAYSDAVFFDKFYLPILEYVPNYDGSRQEPLNLTALLPNTLLNGNFGIAPGVNTRTPSFSLGSVVKVLQLALDNKGVCTPEMCMSLEFNTPYGGKAVKTKANKSEFLSFYKTGKGRVTFRSTHSGIDPKTNSIRFDEFAPVSDTGRILGRIESIKGVASTRDDSDKHDKHQTAFVVTFVKSLKGEDLALAIKQAESEFQSSYTYNVQVTDRILVGDGKHTAKLRPTTVPDLLTHWIKYRIDLEKKACAYWIVEKDKEIAYINLMRLAISNLDFIFACVRNKKLDDAGLVDAISKKLKITSEQTNQILGRNLRQLRHLEDDRLVAQVKEMEEQKTSYVKRQQKPGAYIKSHLTELALNLKVKT